MTDNLDEPMSFGSISKDLSMPQIVSEFINPERARYYMTFNVDNRHIMQSHVDRLAADIVADRYTQTHEGIAFDINSQLYDGQHRLLAIIKAGKGVDVYVATGMPLAAREKTNVNSKAKTAGDLLHQSGMVRNDSRGFAAVVKAFYKGAQLKKLSDTQLMELATKYYDAIRWVMEQFEHRKGHVQFSIAAPVKAGLARAWEHHKHNSSVVTSLARVCELLMTGLIDSSAPSETIIIQLRDRMRGERSSTHKGRCELYQLTTTAISLYLKGKPVGLRLSTATRHYPIVEDSYGPPDKSDIVPMTPLPQGTPRESRQRYRTTLLHTVATTMAGGVTDKAAQIAKDLNRHFCTRDGAVSEITDKQLEAQITELQQCAQHVLTSLQDSRNVSQSSSFY